MANCRRVLVRCTGDVTPRMTPLLTRTKPKEPRTLTPNGPVGFSTLPDQVVNRAVSGPFVYNILCVGETGIGKSTLVDSLFKRNLGDEPVTHRDGPVQLVSRTHDLEEPGVQLKLTVTHTEAYGDQIDKRQSVDPIIEFIEAQYEAYFQEELKSDRHMDQIVDTRVHVCLFFLPPTGHTLKALDLLAMRRISEKVNLIPIIAKADTILSAELHSFKQRVKSELEEAGVSIYTSPVDDAVLSSMPFSVVGSRDTIVINGQPVRGRQYPWGVVEVENEKHSEFVKLREVLLRTHTGYLQQTTQEKYYGDFRRANMKAMGYVPSDTFDLASVRARYEQQKDNLEQSMRANEQRVRKKFFAKVQKLEAQMTEQHRQVEEKMQGLGRILEADTTKLDTQFAELEAQIQAYNKTHGKP